MADTLADTDSLEVAPAPQKRTSLGLRFAAWMLAILAAGVAMLYQRATGPTYPLKGTVTDAAGKVHKYKLIRTHETTGDATVEIPDPGENVDATLHYRRYSRTAEPEAFTAVKMESGPRKQKEEGWFSAFLTRIIQSVYHSTDDQPQLMLQADLPKQFAAGKLEYYIEVEGSGEPQRLPADPNKNVIIRYKDPVPDAVLAPHVTMMILTIIFGMRAAMGALFDPGSMRRYAWLSLACMTVGGMVLGPIVQKYAFGEYWTGFPWGKDWTDNKMLVMWGAWIVGCSIIGFKRREKEGLNRFVVFTAAAVMITAYMVPHSMGGSELDYSKLDQVTDPKDAIRTGK